MASTLIHTIVSYINKIHVRNSQSEGAVYDVSNKRRLGITEVEAVRQLAEGVAALIAAEERTN